jgi:hypothetical protein
MGGRIAIESSASQSGVFVSSQGTSFTTYRKLLSSSSPMHNGPTLILLGNNIPTGLLVWTDCAYDWMGIISRICI